jgi:GAF domain-containing protein
LSGDVDTHAIIADQARRIVELEARLGEFEPLRGVRDAVSAAGVLSRIELPHSESGLLELVVQSAANVINAVAGAIFLIDQREQELMFEVAIGPQAAATRGVRVPLGHGIAGLVAVTGQPMAVSDVQSDARHASDIAGQIGYEPHSILCVPLSRGGEVIGVIELLDKRGQAAFSPADIQVLGHFAELASVAIDQSQIVSRLSALIQRAIFSALDDPDGDSQGGGAASVALAAHIEADVHHQRAVRLADTIRRISLAGTTELDAAHAILSGFADYLDQTALPARPAGKERS